MESRRIDTQISEMFTPSSLGALLSIQYSQVTLEKNQAAKIILCKPLCGVHSLEGHSLGGKKIFALSGM